MKEMVHIRVFELNGSQYFLIGSSHVSLEEYVVDELNAGYMVSDMANFGIDRFRVITSYAPVAVERYLASGSEALRLSDDKVDSV